MKASRCRALAEGEAVSFTLDGNSMTGRAGEPAAVALMAEGVDVFARSIKYHRPRGPFCLDGRCEGCLMRVDGIPNVATCRVPLREGLRLERQNAFPSARVDLLSAIDWFFPGGMDHHQLGARLPGPLNRAMQKVARRVGGLGQVPDRPPTELAAVRHSRIDLLVVGAGPAGLCAARSAALRGRRVVLGDEEAEVGGSLAYDPERPAVLAELARDVEAAGVEVRTSTLVAAIYDLAEVVLCDAAGVDVAAVDDVILCCGTHAQPSIHEGNDLPRHLSARAVLRSIVAHGVRPGTRAVVVGDDPSGLLAAQAFTDAGGQVVAVVGSGCRPVGARGEQHVSSFEIEKDGRTTRVVCDLVIVAERGAPEFELCEQAGCEIAFRPEVGGFVPVCDDRGVTRVPHVRVAGHVRGARSREEAMEQGERAGRS